MEQKELAPLERPGILLSCRNAWLSCHSSCHNGVANTNSAAGFLAVVACILLISPLGPDRAALVAYADHCIDNLYKHSIVFALSNT